MLSESKHKSGQMRPANPLPTLHENIRLRCNITNQSTYLIGIKAAIRRFQSYNRET